MVVLNGLVRVEVKWPGTEQESRFVGVGGSVGIMHSVLGRDLPGCGLVAAYGQVRFDDNSNGFSCKVKLHPISLCYNHRQLWSYALHHHCVVLLVYLLQGNALGRGPMVLHLPMRLFSTIRQRAAPAIEAVNSCRTSAGDLRTGAAASPGESKAASACDSPLLAQRWSSAEGITCGALHHACHIHARHMCTVLLQVPALAQTCREQLAPCCLVVLG